MKKKLLTLLTLTAATYAFAYQKAAPTSITTGLKIPALKQTLQTNADGEIESYAFSYASEPDEGNAINGVTGGTTRVYIAFEMTASDIKTFAGSKVTGFSVYSPYGGGFSSNTITDARFFYSLDLKNETYSQEFNLTKSAGGLNTLSINEPLTISGEEDGIVFGYSLVVPKKDNMFYLITDGILNNPTTCLYGMTDEETFPDEWYTLGEELGALCMSINLERENLPKFASFASFPASVYLPLGQTSALPITLKATSGSPIESVEIEYNFCGHAQNANLVFDPAIPAGAARYIRTYLEFPAFNELYNETVSFNIAKINGIENGDKGANIEAAVVVIKEVPVHQTLLEEYTGSWCPYCPRGYAALEYIRENHPDFVVAAFHNSDPMEITTDYPSQFSGYPTAVLNRNSVVDPYYGAMTNNIDDIDDTELPIVNEILALNAVPTAWKVKVDHVWASDDELVAKAEVANVVGFENKTYQMVYMLVADGLTGSGRDWWQSNTYYYSIGPQFIPQLNAFCRGGEYGQSLVKDLIFYDVVISTTGIYGVEGSLPSSLSAEEVAEHSISFNLTNIPADLLPDKNKLRVIAAIVDIDGNVLNCAKDEVNDYEESSVGAISTTESAPEYFNLNGQKLSDPYNGIVIKKTGGKAEKVIIR